jgi:hypothetical protein
MRALPSTLLRSALNMRGDEELHRKMIVFVLYHGLRKFQIRSCPSITSCQLHWQNTVHRPDYNALYLSLGVAAASATGPVAEDLQAAALTARGILALLPSLCQFFHMPP